MSISPGTNALRALAAAWEARRIYGVTHQASRLAVERCLIALEDVTRRVGAVTLAICEDGIVWGDEIVTDRALTSSQFMSSLAAHDRSYIRVSAGATVEDVEWMLETGSDAGAPRSPSGKVVRGLLGVATGGASGGVSGGASGGSREAAPAGQTRPSRKSTASRLWTPGQQGADHAPLKTALSSLLAGSRRVPGEIGALAAQIMSAVVTARSGLVSLVDLKDHDEYTFVHAVNVGLLASALGQAVGLSNDRLTQITEAALLHDVGKRMIPITILGKKHQLSDDERAVMQTHPALGASLLAGVRGVSDLAVVAAHEHHMRVDGGGYPASPRGKFPALTSQLIQIADIFDALRSDRPYRPGMSIQECLDVMSKDSGRSFDSDLFDLFRSAVVSRFAAVPGPPQA